MAACLRRRAACRSRRQFEPRWRTLRDLSTAPPAPFLPSTSPPTCGALLIKGPPPKPSAPLAL
eukprot:6811321-Pyramimonas_sp.AAC.1